MNKLPNFKSTALHCIKDKLNLKVIVKFKFFRKHQQIHAKLNAKEHPMQLMHICHTMGLYRLSDAGVRPIRYQVPERRNIRSTEFCVITATLGEINFNVHV